MTLCRGLIAALLALTLAACDPGPVYSGQTDRVRASLADVGDDGTAVREVVHTAWPLDGVEGASLDSVSYELSAAGFDVHEVYGGGVAFGHRTEVASARFETFTEAIALELAYLGWEYAGWQTVAVPSGS